jgi:hypothetical protein
MRFVDIVASGLVSGSYYIGGGSCDIDALRNSKSTWHLVRTYQRTHRACSKTRSLPPQYTFIVGLWIIK